MIYDIEEIKKNSYSNFHAKGLDYICLQRDPLGLTHKLYFFEGDVTKIPEVVIPHDHLYDFHTHVLVGSYHNHWYKESNRGKTYQRFNYYTPLNGGSGFVWDQEIKLEKQFKRRFFKGEICSSRSEEIHTISIGENETCLYLVQMSDRTVSPSKSYSLDKEPPSLSGLYDEMTEDKIIKRLAWLETKGIIL